MPLKVEHLDELTALGFPPDAIAQAKAQLGQPEAVSKCPTVGQLIEEAKVLRAEIQRREKLIKTENKYLTADKWRYGQVLANLRGRLACTHGEWGRALETIGERRQRADEAIKIGKQFKSAEEAGKVPIRTALKLIRKEDNRNPAEDTFATPDWLFNRLDSVYHFGLDAAASADNSKCAKFITPEQDALKCDWKKLAGGKAVFVNPPFCIAEEFVRYGWRQAQKDIDVVMIVPFWQSKDWFKEVVWTYGELRIIGKKVIYKGVGAKEGSAVGNYSSPAMMETLVVVFRKNQKAFLGASVWGSSRQEGKNVA